MVIILESEASPEASMEPRRSHNWLKVGAFAAASALAGGLAFAWHYRKTIARLRQSERVSRDSDFRKPREYAETDD
jgi:membrane associated rhomboid family serine protease